MAIWIYPYGWLYGHERIEMNGLQMGGWGAASSCSHHFLFWGSSGVLKQPSGRVPSWNFMLQSNKPAGGGGVRTGGTSRPEESAADVIPLHFGKSPILPGLVVLPLEMIRWRMKGGCGCGCARCGWAKLLGFMDPGFMDPGFYGV